ncbi:hypothetical protein [Streptacidiphilus sp. EB103A]|uniref:hypothetical protein n=1 Tax=Streptacidiphilus sp. EB103A TaxID=3156275 RepID=UPI003512BA3C
MLPVVAPSVYHGLPQWFQTIAGSAITSATLTAFALNLLFNHLPLGQPTDAPSTEATP